MMRRLLAPVWILLLASSTAAQHTVPQQPVRYGPPITISKAMSIVQRAMAKSSASGFKMAIAVVEPSGELVAFARMDDAPYASVQLAQKKARTAARLRIPTTVLEQRVLGGRTVLLSSDEVVPIGGGLPIIEDGKVIGAVGISGATADQDAAIAEASLASR